MDSVALFGPIPRNENACDRVHRTGLINRCQLIVVLLAIANILDALSTHLLLEIFPQGRELNPILFLVIEQAGLQGFWLVKIGVSVSILFGVRLLRTKCLRSVYSAIRIPLFLIGSAVALNVVQLLMGTLLGL